MCVTLGLVIDGMRGVSLHSLLRLCGGVASTRVCAAAVFVCVTVILCVCASMLSLSLVLNCCITYLPPFSGASSCLILWSRGRYVCACVCVRALAFYEIPK